MTSDARRRRRALLRMLGTLAALASCRPAPVAQPGQPQDCALTDDTAARETRVAVPAGGSTAPLHAQLYETLVSVDCTGSVRAGLAAAWSDSAGITWRFELRPAAAFPDGRSVDAQAVLRSWTDTSRSLATSFAALSAEGSRVLHVELHEPARAHLFADSTFAVTGATNAAGVPLGTTDWRVADEPETLVSGSGRSLSAVPYEDMRAALNDGVHALVTADPAVLAYARSRPGYDTAPLPWTRTYVIATAGASAESRLPAEVLGTLARDVVGGEVRAAEPPFWWEHVSCGVPGVRFTNRQARDIVYPQNDRVAQALAERIAALAWPAAAAPGWLRDLLPAGYGSAGAPRTRGLDDAALRSVIRTRLPLAVIASAPRMYDRLCMGSRADTTARELLEAGWQSTPLLDARDVLVHRDGIGRVLVDAFGTIRFAPR